MTSGHPSPWRERLRERVPNRAAPAGREAVRDWRGDERDPSDAHWTGAVQRERMS